VYVFTYPNPNTDPFSNSLFNLWRENQNVLDSVLGSANYDVGHLFTLADLGGYAGGIGAVCRARLNPLFRSRPPLLSLTRFFHAYKPHEQRH